MSESLDLSHERAVFESHKHTLLPRHEGKFAVVVGEDIVDVVPDLERAWAIGFELARGPQFLAAEITAEPRQVIFPAAVVRLT